jgi:hypothetical protein
MNSTKHHHYSKRFHDIILQRLSRDAMLKVSLAVNLLLVLTWMWSRWNSESIDRSLLIRGYERTWHGGHPMAQDHKGSCWCGAEDGYCMCTPNVAIDLILVSKSDNNNKDDSFLWLVQRKDTNQLATMGGFVDVGETVEQRFIGN